jgi:hypothetical protein
MQRAEQVSGAVPGTQAFLGALQASTTYFWKELSEEEVEEYEVKAREWSENVPPHHIQSRQAYPHFCAHRNIHPIVQDGLCSNPRTDSAGFPNSAL